MLEGDGDENGATTQTTKIEDDDDADEPCGRSADPREYRAMRPKHSARNDDEEFDTDEEDK